MQDRHEDLSIIPYSLTRRLHAVDEGARSDWRQVEARTP
jgi:hypothetical protein